jgi:hypothetical protein
MQTLHGMLAQTIHEDRAREYAHPSRRHAAELRRSRPQRSLLRTLSSATIGRFDRDATAASGPSCTTADGRVGRLVARIDGTQRVLDCEVG